MTARQSAPNGSSRGERLAPSPLVLGRMAVLALALRSAGGLAGQAAAEAPDWLVPSLHAGGVLMGTRLGASALWPEAFDVTDIEANWGHFKEAWSSAPVLEGRTACFEWDHDPWPINLVGHAALGSEIYLRYRQSRHSGAVALAVTVAWTIVWEYMVEAWHKRPSGIDLIWTPVGGAMLGEGRYQLYRSIDAMRPSIGRHLLLYAVDPLGQMERDLLGLPY